jgi:hypothetical protein
LVTSEGEQCPILLLTLEATEKKIGFDFY